MTEDLLFCEEHGRMHDANPELITKEAKKRGKDQLGTLRIRQSFS